MTYRFFLSQKGISIVKKLKGAWL